MNEYQCPKTYEVTLIRYKAMKEAFPTLSVDFRALYEDTLRQNKETNYKYGESPSVREVVA